MYDSYILLYESAITVRLCDWELLFEAVEDEITEQLRLANDTSAIHHIDIATLAPKKIDWDLKRDIQGVSGMIEERNELREIERERVEKGSGEA